MVNVTGTAASSAASWSQTTYDDFSAGNAPGLLIDSAGSLSLGTSVYDDFNGNSLDTSKWTAYADAGLSVKDQNQKLHLGGTSSSMAWSNAGVKSNGFVSNDVQANITAFSGSGDGWSTGMGLYQDDQNTISINEHYDWTWGYIQLTTSYNKGGVAHEDHFQNLGNNPAPHTFRVQYSSGTVYLYMDGNQINSVDMVLQDPLFAIGISAVDQAHVDATWDDATYPTLDTNYTSMIFDSLSVHPVLTKVAWNDTAPAGTAVKVSIRSGDAPDLSDASAWMPVTNGQLSGLPAVKQYLQYNVRMTTNDEYSTPVFKDITITYNKPVAKVEVSIDGKQTWMPATGTSQWYIDLVLPENTTIAWVRATDVAGDTNLTSIELEVDTTPPTGSIVINDNARFTINNEVTLKLNATDHYGVASMMVSEQPDFAGITWMDYAAKMDFTLSDGDGLKTVYVEYQDNTGHVSDIYNATILLDTLPPVGSVLINNGDGYTQNTTVTLTINASDPIGVSSMMVSGTQDFQGAQWVDYATTMQFSFAPGSGTQVVYIRFRDAGGHISQAFSDSIIEDQQAPTVAVVINGGAPYTQSANVTVTLIPTENYQVATMQVGPGDITSISSLPWSTFQANVNLTMSQGEGAKTISARLQDAAGNIGAVNSSTIILDYTAPVTTIGVLPATSAKAAFTVSWTATDATSGVLFYDVQQETLNGTWTDWLLHTNQTSAVFTGADLQTYSFRARAQDKAGNLGAYPATVSNAITVQLPEPVVSFIKPKEKATVSGTITVTGSCQLVTDGRNVTMVQWTVDNGTWQTADGTLSWSFKQDTTKLKDGKHTLEVRTYDGTHYSTVIERVFSVKNANAKGFLGADGTLVFLVAAAIGLILTVRGRQRGPGRREL